MMHITPRFDRESDVPRMDATTMKACWGFRFDLAITPESALPDPSQCETSLPEHMPTNRTDYMFVRTKEGAEPAWYTDIELTKEHSRVQSCFFYVM